jgi:hypothetical protein
MSDINPNEDSDFELFEEAGGSEPAIAPEPASPAPKGNRPFVLAAGITGGIIVLGLIGLLGYNLVIGPQQQAARQQRAAQVLSENTATAQAATDVVAALQATENAAKAPQTTSTSTQAPATALPPVATKEPTKVLAQASPTPPVAGAITGGTLTSPEMTATMGSLQTQLASASSATPRATSLPTTGFADEVGLPGLIGLAAVFVAIILVVRGLRSRK